jgi:hypothetical protein
VVRAPKPFEPARTTASSSCVSTYERAQVTGMGTVRVDEDNHFLQDAYVFVIHTTFTQWIDWRRRPKSRLTNPEHVGIVTTPACPGLSLRVPLALVMYPSFGLTVLAFTLTLKLMLRRIPHLPVFPSRIPLLTLCLNIAVIPQNLELTYSSS